MSYFYKYIDPAKLIADQTGEGYDPPNYDEDSENKTLLSGNSPRNDPKETHTMSDVENTYNGTTTKTVPSPSDEESEF